MPPILRRHRIAVVCVGMAAFAAVLACTCKLPLSLQPTPTETLPPVLTETQAPPTVATTEPTATATAAVIVAPTTAVPIVVPATKTKVPPTITLTTAPPPGGGSWGIVQSDLELYGVSRVSPIGATTTLTLDVRNYGPNAFEGPLRVVCVAQGYQLADASQPCAPAVADVTVEIHQGVGTGHFDVSLSMTNPACFYPGGQCSIIVPENKDPNPANNQYGFSLP
ncbi:MAG: hypothetical protein MUO23_01630 [Anaerolineales bacterium]|nr:hypothetical protein [Anaerolineales bacterium]